MSGNQWWKHVTQLRDIKDGTILNHQIAKQQLVYVLTIAIQNSILPDVIAQIVLNFLVNEELYKQANNDELGFALKTFLLSPTQKLSNVGSKKTRLWQANYKKCVGIEFKLKKDITICGIELDVFFGGVQCYAVLSGYKRNKNKSLRETKRNVYDNEFIYKLIPCDHRQKCNKRSRNSSEMIFTEINDLNHGGLKLLAKNRMYKLGFIVSDGFYCNKYIDVKALNKQNIFAKPEDIKDIEWRLLNKSRLLGGQCTYFRQGIIEEDGTSNALKWIPKIRFLTF